MRNVPTPPRQIDETLAPQPETNVGTTTPAQQQADARMPSIDRLLRHRICSAKSLIKIVGGLGLTLMAVELFEYLGQSPATASNKPIPASVTAVATEDTPTSGTCNRQAREAITAVRATVSDARKAIELSQADVAQADINIQTFKAKYDRELERYRRGAGNSQQLARARVAYDFGKQQKQIALEGLRHAQVQLTEAVNLVKTRSQLARAGTLSD
jgi:hypothetical protein